MSPALKRFPALLFHVSAHRAQIRWSVYMGEGTFKDFDLQLQGFFWLCWFVLLFFSWGIFLVLFPFFNLGNDR